MCENKIIMEIDIQHCAVGRKVTANTASKVYRLRRVNYNVGCTLYILRES